MNATKKTRSTKSDAQGRGSQQRLAWVSGSR